jgi:hypothetical protein
MPGSQSAHAHPVGTRSGIAILIAGAVVASVTIAMEGSRPAAGQESQKTRTLKTKRAVYKITTKPKEADSDKAEEAEIAEAKKKVEDSGESYAGTDRKAAKLSISEARVEDIADLKDLIASLPSKQTMVNKHISTKANSGRVAEEERNVRTTGFIYAASKESDNDFHLIVGRAPGSPELYMTMELSGLPPSSSGTFAVLKAARDVYEGFFNGGGEDRRPGPDFDFYDPPIPVQIEGSLFFDETHARGTPPGPVSLRPNMPVIWEVHPITKITFEP